MIKTIILDFDGVIIDTETKKFETLRHILKNTCFVLKENDFKDMIGKKTGEFLASKFQRMSEHEIKRITELRREKQLANAAEGLIPGIKDLLAFIKSKKARMALTTGSTREIVNKIIEANGIKDYFDVIISGEDFKKSKPSPECYEKTLEKLKVSRSEAIIIEDSIAGIKAAKAAKCKVFGIMTYFDKTELHEADRIFKDHFEILNYFKENKII